MRLKIQIGSHVIASMPLNEAEACNLEYIYSKRCLLAEACAAVIANETESPVYFIEVESRMNRKVKGRGD